MMTHIMKTLYKFFKTAEVSQERAGEHETKVEKYNLLIVKFFKKDSLTNKKISFNYLRYHIILFICLPLRGKRLEILQLLHT
jgi:hypothetical protein